MLNSSEQIPFFPLARKLVAHPATKSQSYRKLVVHPATKSQSYRKLVAHPATESQGYRKLVAHPATESQSYRKLVAHPESHVSTLHLIAFQQHMEATARLSFWGGVVSILLLGIWALIIGGQWRVKDVGSTERNGQGISCAWSNCLTAAFGRIGLQWEFACFGLTSV